MHLAKRYAPKAAIFANGSLHNVEQAVAALDDGADIITIGRGALANPDLTKRLSERRTSCSSSSLRRLIACLPTARPRSISGRTFHMRRSFIGDMARHDIEASAASLRRPLLVMHAPLDAVVGIDHASRLFLAAKHPKSFISPDQADHLLTRCEDADCAAEMIAAWASRYLPPIIADLPQVEAVAGVSAVETRNGLLQLEIRSGKHRLIADEPTSVGGLGSGLSPYEFVSARLAACTAMTMRLYAERKGLPLDRAHVVVEHEKQPGMTPPDCFNRTITLDGPLDEEQRQKLLSIADRCPVDRTLVRGSDVVTHLAARRPEAQTASMDADTSLGTSE
jgi:uncharacterized OsmC-like protein